MGGDLGSQDKSVVYCNSLLKLVITLFLALFLNIDAYGDNSNSVFPVRLIVFDELQGQYDVLIDYEKNQSWLSALLNPPILYFNDAEELLCIVCLPNKGSQNLFNKDNVSINGDSIHLRTQLNQEIFWSDGVPLTGEDILYTWNLARSSLAISRARSGWLLINNVEVNPTNSKEITFNIKIQDFIPSQLSQLRILPRKKTMEWFKNLLRTTGVYNVSSPYLKKPELSGLYYGAYQIKEAQKSKIILKKNPYNKYFRSWGDQIHVVDREYLRQNKYLAEYGKVEGILSAEPLMTSQYLSKISKSELFLTRSSTRPRWFDFILFANEENSKKVNSWTAEMVMLFETNTIAATEKISIDVKSLFPYFSSPSQKEQSSKNISGKNYISSNAVLGQGQNGGIPANSPAFSNTTLKILAPKTVYREKLVASIKATGLKHGVTVEIEFVEESIFWQRYYSQNSLYHGFWFREPLQTMMGWLLEINLAKDSQKYFTLPQLAKLSNKEMLSYWFKTDSNQDLAVKLRKIFYHDFPLIPLALEGSSYDWWQLKEEKIRPNGWYPPTLGLVMGAQ